jgi:hypothetical protein
MTVIVSGEFVTQQSSSVSTVAVNSWRPPFERQPRGVKVVTRWMIIQDTNFYKLGGEKLVSQHAKCLSCGGTM